MVMNAELVLCVFVFFNMILANFRRERGKTKPWVSKVGCWSPLLILLYLKVCSDFCSRLYKLVLSEQLYLAMFNAGGRALPGA